MGIMHLAVGPSKGGTSPAFYLILVVLFGAFYLLMIRPQRNRARRAVQVQGQVSAGQRIRTTAGMYGTVVSGDDRDLVVEIAPGVHVTMLRRAVMEVLPDDASVVDDEPSQEDAADDQTYDHEASVEFDCHDAQEQPNGSAPTDQRDTDQRDTDQRDTDQRETKDSSI